MVTTNIQIFNENQNNTLLDSEYNNCTERTNGFLGVLARANVFNKFCYQVSLVCRSIADFMVGRGYDANDSDSVEFTNNFRDSIISVITEQINLRVPNVRAKNTNYKKGDVLLDASLPLWGELECITAGKTSNSNFSSLLPNPINYIGLQIQDGTVLWVLRAKRFLSPKGTPIPFVGQFVAHTVSENGKTKTYYVPKHPELGLEMLDYRFCDGQTVSGYSTINMQNRFLMCRGSATAGNGNAGADNVKLETKHLPTNKFGLTLTCKDWDKKFSLEGTFTSENENQKHSHELDTYTGVWCVKSFTDNFVPGYYATGKKKSKENDISHTHKVKVKFENINLTHSHEISGSVRLNSSNQQTFSVVSQHYKIAYIQRIY